MTPTANAAAAAWPGRARARAPLPRDEAAESGRAAAMSQLNHDDVLLGDRCQPATGSESEI